MTNRPPVIVFVLALLGLLTRIPGLRADLDKAAHQTWALPLVGLILGGLVFVVVWILNVFLDDQWLVAALGVVVLYRSTGLLHLDGLGDVADARMALDPENALRDPRLGIGGTYGLIMTIFLLVILLRSHIEHQALEVVIIAEVAAKVAMLTTLRFGHPRGDGMGRQFVELTNWPRFVAGVGIASVLLVLVSGPRAIFVVPIAVIVGLGMAASHNRKWGFVNGDVVGATNEVGRIITLLVLVVIL